MSEQEICSLMEGISKSLVPRLKTWILDPLRNEIAELRQELHALQVEKCALELCLRTIESQAEVKPYPAGLSAKVTPRD